MAACAVAPGCRLFGGAVDILCRFLCGLHVLKFLALPFGGRGQPLVWSANTAGVDAVGAKIWMDEN